MRFKEFHERFGGSFRTKNLSPAPPGMGGMLRWVVDRVRSRPRRSPVNKAFHVLPPRSAIPKELIRLDPWEAEYLFMMASRAKSCIVEIGRLHGGSSFLLACANETVPIHSIDVSPKDDDRLRRLLAEHGVGKNLELIVGDSQKADHPAISSVDLLFIDGDHSYEGCTNDLENWYPRVVPGGHVLLHDSYFGCEVQSAVIDFTRGRRVEHVRSPYIIASHWHSSYGSMAHFIKEA